MTRLLLAVVCLALPGAAMAQAWFDAAVAGWDGGKLRPASDFVQVSFHDENGIARTMHMSVEGLDDWINHTGPLNRPLWVFQAVPTPVVSKRELGGKQIELIQLEKNNFSGYYVVRNDSTMAVVSRRERPATQLQARLKGMWSEASGLFPASDAPDTAHWSRWLIVAKPAGVLPASSVPLTDSASQSELSQDGLFARRYGQCSGLPKWWTAERMSTEDDLMKAHTPLELELLDAPLIEDADAWQALVQGRYEAANSMRSYVSLTEPNRFLKNFRKRLAEALKKERDAATTKTVLTPAESRFISCRMLHLGVNAHEKFAKKADAAAAGGEKAAEDFVAYWRAFIAQEWSLAVDEGAAALPMPDLPKHADLETTLTDRTQKALDGKFAPPQAAVVSAPKAPAPPKITRETQRSKQAKIEKMVNVLD